MNDIRPAAVAGTWYSADATELAADLDVYLEAAGTDPRVEGLVALIAPHAGLMYSGPVAAHAYRQLTDRPIDTLLIVGPSHFVAFDGVAAYARGAFDSPLGLLAIDAAFARDLLIATPAVQADRNPHRREDSPERKVPFIRAVAARILI